MAGCRAGGGPSPFLSQLPISRASILVFGLTTRPVCLPEVLPASCILSKTDDPNHTHRCTGGKVCEESGLINSFKM